MRQDDAFGFTVISYFHGNQIARLCTLWKASQGCEPSAARLGREPALCGFALDDGDAWVVVLGKPCPLLVFHVGSRS